MEPTIRNIQNLHTWKAQQYNQPNMKWYLDELPQHT